MGRPGDIGTKFASHWYCEDLRADDADVGKLMLALFFLMLLLLLLLLLLAHQ